MNKFRPLRMLSILIAGSLLVLLAWNVYQKLDSQGSDKKANRERLPAPVEVSQVEVGPIELRRSFTGTLEARSSFVVAPKISGRIERLEVDLSDRVTRGQLIAVLDDAEYVQDVVRARADLEVARASHQEAEGLLKFAQREFERLERLQARGDVSASQLDIARSEQLVKRALTQVTLARITRAEADLAAARIRLAYTQVRAEWNEGNPTRVVAERFIDAGETVAANAPLLRIVEIDPIKVVFYITERDYSRLLVGQAASLETDAFPAEVFHGSVKRIAPVFRESTRQARVELLVENPDLRLKPGMFVRATVMLVRVDDAVIVPEQALTRRDDQLGVFLVAADGGSARWHPVETGIRQGNRIQLLGEPLNGRVVVLGQQLLEDGAALMVVEENTQ